MAYQLGPHTAFALEGAVSIAGQSVRWLKDNLKFFDEIVECGKNNKILFAFWLKYYLLELDYPCVHEVHIHYYVIIMLIKSHPNSTLSKLA